MAAPQQTQYNQAELERLSHSTSKVGNEELLLAAMFGKVLQNDINGIKQKSAEVGGGLKVSDVDMSKVMPSHILPAMGIKTPQQRPPLQQQRPPLQQPVPQQPVSVQQSQWIPAQETIAEPNVTPALTLSDPDQMDFDLNKKVHYEDILNAIDKLETKVNMLTDKINILIEANNKKKPKITNGT